MIVQCYCIGLPASADHDQLFLAWLGGGARALLAAATAAAAAASNACCALLLFLDYERARKGHISTLTNCNRLFLVFAFQRNLNPLEDFQDCHQILNCEVAASVFNRLAWLLISRSALNELAWLYFLIDWLGLGSQDQHLGLASSLPYPFVLSRGLSGRLNLTALSVSLFLPS